MLIAFAIALFLVSLVAVGFCFLLYRLARRERERPAEEREHYRESLEKLRAQYQQDVTAAKERADAEISARQNLLSKLRADIERFEQSRATWRGEVERRAREAIELQQECSTLRDNIASLEEERFILDEEVHRLEAAVSRCEHTLESLKSEYLQKQKELAEWHMTLALRKEPQSLLHDAYEGRITKQDLVGGLANHLSAMAKGTPIELDLHGHTVAEALSAFVSVYNICVGTHPIRGIIVIHGHQSSNPMSIKTVIRELCERHADKMIVRHGEEWSRNPGRTLIIPIRPLPTESSQILRGDLP